MVSYPRNPCRCRVTTILCNLLIKNISLMGAKKNYKKLLMVIEFSLFSTTTFEKNIFNSYCPKHTSGASHNRFSEKVKQNMLQALNFYQIDRYIRNFIFNQLKCISFLKCISITPEEIGILSLHFNWCNFLSWSMRTL